MKKYFLFVALATMCAFTSCQKESVGGSVDRPVVTAEKAVVTLNLTGGNVTKAGDVDETKVSSIQVFVFNGDGVDGYKAATADEITALSLQVSATAGTRDIYAFVNAPDLSSYSSKANLLAAVSLFSDNASDKFVMSGKLENQTVGASYSGTVKVDRYAARIRISKITRNFKIDAIKNVKFQITKMYLTSVVSNELYSFGAPDTYTWLNASFGSSNALSTDNDFVYYKPSTAISLANEASHSQAYSFYAYANTNAEDDTADPKTYKRTRLVIECQIDVDGNGTFDDDEYYTYPIQMGALASNKSYEIKELVLTRLGNKSNGDDNADEGEDDDISSTDAQITIEINDWTEVLVGTEGTVTI